MKKLNRRGVSGLGYVLVFLGILSASVMIAMLFPYIARTITQRPILTVEGVPVVAKEGNTYYIYITLKNSGNQEASVVRVTLAYKNSWSTSKGVNYRINPGQTLSLRISLPSAPPTNAYQLNGVVQTSAGEIMFKAVVLGRS